MKKRLVACILFAMSITTWCELPQPWKGDKDGK